MASEINQVIEVNGWVVRLSQNDRRQNDGGGLLPVFVMLHGWTGDENVMWVFASRLPPASLILSPRGLYPTPMGGYNWQPQNVRAFPDVDDFKPAIEALSALLTPGNFPAGDWSQASLVGFSQGAALAYTFALTHPERVKSVAGLSGFMPGGTEKIVAALPLTGKAAFMAHGLQDDLVPVERARQAAQILQQAGAQVTTCEDDVGHKLSASCFRGLQAFFENQ